jgi:phage gpG-like protein
MIRTRIEGETFAGLGAELLAELQPKAEAAVNRGVDIAFAKVEELLSRPAQGGRASDAGLPPAMRRGRLRKGLRKRAARTVGNVILGAVENIHPAAGAHEYGGRVGRGKRIVLPARPSLRPGFEQVEPEVDAVLRNL